MKKILTWEIVLALASCIIFLPISQAQNCPTQGCPVGPHGLRYLGPSLHWDPCSPGVSGQQPYPAGLFSNDPLVFIDAARTVPPNFYTLPDYVLNILEGLTDRQRSWGWDYLTCDEQQDLANRAILIGSNPSWQINFGMTVDQWIRVLFDTACPATAPTPRSVQVSPPSRPAVCEVGTAATPTPTPSPSPTPTPAPTGACSCSPTPTPTPTPDCPCRQTVTLKRN
jgi:hypothetical protein